MSELLQYIASIALLIAILLAFSVTVYLVGKLRGKSSPNMQISVLESQIESFFAIPTPEMTPEAPCRKP